MTEQRALDVHECAARKWQVHVCGGCCAVQILNLLEDSGQCCQARTDYHRALLVPKHIVQFPLFRVRCTSWHGVLRLQIFNGAWAAVMVLVIVIICKEDVQHSEKRCSVDVCATFDTHIHQAGKIINVKPTLPCR